MIPQVKFSNNKTPGLRITAVFQSIRWGKWMLRSLLNSTHFLSGNSHTCAHISVSPSRILYEMPLRYRCAVHCFYNRPKGIEIRVWILQYASCVGMRLRSGARDKRISGLEASLGYTARPCLKTGMREQHRVLVSY